MSIGEDTLGHPSLSPDHDTQTAPDPTRARGRRAGRSRRLDKLSRIPRCRVSLLRGVRFFPAGAIARGGLISAGPAARVAGQGRIRRTPGQSVPSRGTGRTGQGWDV